MRRFAVLMAAFAVLALPPANAGAQGLLDGLPGVGSINWGSVSITGHAKFGVQRMGLNFDVTPPFVPFGSRTGWWLAIRPIELRVDRANLPVGSLAFDITAGDRCRLFVNAEGNLKRDVTVVTKRDSWYAPPFPDPSFEWKGSQIEWWNAEAALIYQVWGTASVVAGLRREHISLGLTDPRVLAGAPGYAIFAAFRRYTGDFLIKAWIPYAGLQIATPYYKGTIIASPFAAIDVTLPFRVLFDRPGFPLDTASEENQYSFHQTGAFAEAGLEHTANLRSYFDLTVWGKWSWLHAEGSGSDSWNGVARVSRIPGERSGNAAFSRYLLQAGLSANFTF